MATSSLTLSVDSTQVQRVLNALCAYAGLPVTLANAETALNQIVTTAIVSAESSAANAAALAAVPPIVPPVITVVSP
jgi:hypothetical protein